MKMISGRRTLALALGGVFLLSGAMIAPAVRAQDAGAGEPTKPISLNLHNVPIQTALQLLFTGAGIRNTSIANDVQGYANITVNEVPFSLALRTLLSSVNPPLTYDVVDGVYQVKVLRAVVPPAAPVISTVPVVDPNSSGTAAADGPKRFYRIPIDKYDAYYIARLLGAQGIVEVGVNDVIPAGGGQGNNGGGNNRQGGGFGGNTGFGGGGGFGGGSGPNITSVGGNTGGFGGGGFGGGGFGGGGRYGGGGVRGY
jgi:hypothetical protein